jgi:hypothetical protein
MERETELIARSPLFETLRIHGGAVFDTARPGPDDFQRLLDARDPPVLVSNGAPLRIVRQGPKPVVFEEKYEARTYLRGELQVRADHWHDYFNVLVWLAFPRSKAALNARHFTALREQHAAGAPNRGPVQDALTLFDEGGVVVASSDDDLLDLLQEWRWKELFWANRARLQARAWFALFGHALYEKAQQPFVGITGRGILLRMESQWLAAPPPERLAELDARLAAHLADTGRLQATRELAVVPILGVPGWSADNERESYYDNTDYFRPRRTREKRDS